MFFGANLPVCQGRSTPYIGGGHPTRNRESLWLYKPPYCWVDDHPLLWSEIRTVNELRCWIGTGNAGFHYGFMRLYLASSVTFCATCTFTTSAQGSSSHAHDMPSGDWQVLSFGGGRPYGDCKHPLEVVDKVPTWRAFHLWRCQALKKSMAKSLSVQTPENKFWGGWSIALCGEGCTTHIRLKPMHFLILHSITTLVWAHSRCQTPSLLHQDTLPTTAWLVPQILWAHRLSSSRRCLGRARMKKRTKNFRKLWIQWYQRWLARTCMWLRRSTFFANCTHQCAWPYHLRSHARERVPFPATYALGAFALLSPEPPHLIRQGGAVVLGGHRFFQMRVG